MNLIFSSLAVLLFIWASAAEAVPVPFTQVQYDLLGTAEIFDANGNPADDDSFADASPPSVLPLLRDASASSADGSAHAFAAVDDGFVAVGTESLPGAGETAFASAAVAFSGEFVSPGGLLQLWLSFDVNQILPGAGNVELAFAINGLAPENLLFDMGGSNSFTLLRPFRLSAGATGTLDVLLTATAEGGSSNLGNLAFRVESVPEPGTLFILLPGIVLMGAVRRRPVP